MVVSVASVGSAAGAAAYYANDNYYTADQSAEHSEWGGEGAARLELFGKVDAEAFEQVLAGKLPNGAVISGGAGEHVAGMDLTFSAPKSVSLVALIGKDERVIAAHVEAVRTTMAWAEKNLAYALRTEVLGRVRAGLIEEGALGSEAIRLRTFENLNLTHEQMRRPSSYAPGQRLDVFQRQSRTGLERGRYDVAGIDPKSGEVELKRGDRTHRIKPETLATNGKGLALSSPTEIEVRAGDRLIWTTNNRELGIANGSQVDVLRIDRSGLTLHDANATRTLSPDNTLRESLAHGLVLNMHRAQGLTVDRAITVMDSHDRMLNSKNLFYVLSSRAREHLGLHVDSKSGLAEAVGKHRGDVPHAKDVGRDVRSPKGAKQEASTDTAKLEKDKSQELKLQIERGLGRQRPFEIGL